MENGQGVFGEQGVPTPSPSTPGTSPSAIDYKALADALMPAIDKAVERRTQSTHDKRIAGLQSKVAGFEEQLARYQELTKEGFTPGAARTIMSLEQAAASQPEGGQVPSSSPQGGGTPQATPVDLDTILDYSLDPNDPEVVSLMQKNAGEDQFRQLARSRRKRAPQPEQVMPSPGGGHADGDNLESLTQQLVTLMQNPTQNIAKIREIGDKQAALLR